MILDLAAPVVRGGMMSADNLAEAILDAIYEGTGPVLSVYSFNFAPNETVGQLLVRISTASGIPHKKIRVSSVSKIQALGLQIVHDDSNDQAPCHYHIVFPDEPTSLEIEKLVSVFDDPIENPTGGKVNKT